MRALCCLVLAAAVVVGCEQGTSVDTSLPATSSDVVGAFALVSANGTAPPFAAFATSTQQWTLVTDSVTIASNNTWSEATKYFVTLTADGTTTTQFSVVGGTYTIANGLINFTMTQGGSDKFTGSLTGNTLTIVYTGKRFVYTR